MSSHIITINKDLCDFCGVCVGVCFANAILMKENQIFINDEKCEKCCWCADVCPVWAIEVDGSVNDAHKNKYV